MRETIESAAGILILAILLGLCWFGLPSCAHADDFDVATSPTDHAVVAVCPIGWQWGNNEKAPNFIHVEISGITAQVAAFFASPWVDVDGMSLRSPSRYEMLQNGQITDRKLGHIVSVDDVIAAYNESQTP